MHLQPMKDSDGDFSKAKAILTPCRHCRRSEVIEEQWDSHCGGYTDWRYTCKGCGTVWWVEGPDA